MIVTWGTLQDSEIHPKSKQCYNGLFFSKHVMELRQTNFRGKDKTVPQCQYELAGFASIQ